jgi:uncharacterized membrane-anchored protein
MSTTRKTLLAVAAVALAQTAVLAWMVIDRVTLLRSGREIVLPIVPVDPRDLFRGEYVRLDYPISRVPPAASPLRGNPDGAPVRRNDTLYVVLEKTAADDWLPIEISRTLHPQDNPGRIVLKARALWDETNTVSRWNVGRVRYGIESYFVRQGEGPKLEALARDRKLAVLVAVDKAGNAAIKGLIIDGKLQYEEPLL